MDHPASETEAEAALIAFETVSAWMELHDPSFTRGANRRGRQQASILVQRFIMTAGTNGFFLAEVENAEGMFRAFWGHRIFDTTSVNETGWFETDTMAKLAACAALIRDPELSYILA